MTTRRGFLGTLLAPFIARVLPKPTTGGLFNPHANIAARFDERYALTTDAFMERYLRPAAIHFAEEMDRDVFEWMQKRNNPSRFWVQDPHLSPARLPA